MIHRPAAAALTLSLVLLLANGLASAPSARADEPVVKLQATAGDSLSAAETAAINRTLTDYLEALRKKDYARAGSFIDRTTLLASGESMLKTIEPDSTKRDSARARMFGEASREALAKRPTGEIFAAFMRYMEASNPAAGGALENATIQVLAARRMKDVVHVAYQLTLPPGPGRDQPFTQVTAQQMKKIGGKWLILVTE